MLKKIFFHANEFCSIITSYSFNLFVIFPSAIAKKFVSARDTSFLSINKNNQTAREQSSTMVRKYEAPQEEGVL